jgi:hypothetical protein
MNLIVINHYPTHISLFVCGLNVTYIFGLKSIQGPIWFGLMPNLIWAKSLLRANMTSIQN